MANAKALTKKPTKTEAYETGYFLEIGQANERKAVCRTLSMRLEESPEERYQNSTLIAGNASPKDRF
jgi:hypothetical protein